MAGKSYAPQHPAFLPGASTLLCPQVVRRNRAPSSTVSTLGWQSPSLGHPIHRAALSPYLTPPCVSHCTPGQHLKPRACCQCWEQRAVCRAQVKCSQVTRKTLVLYHVHCWHKQDILFSGQNTELLEHPEFLLLSDTITVMLHLPDLRVCGLGKSWDR